MNIQRWAQVPVLGARGAFALGGLMFFMGEGAKAPSSGNGREGEGGPLDRRRDQRPYGKIESLSNLYHMHFSPMNFICLFH